MQLFRQTNVLINQNILYKTVEAAKNALCGDLDIHCDEDTGFIHNSAFNANLPNYSEEYNNNQYYSPFFAKYIDEQIEWLIGNYMNNPSTIIEVGCGKGYFSEIIAEKLPSCKVYGFDTSYAWCTEENPPNLHIFKEYYNMNYSFLRPDAVICRHVIEHIHNPVDFLTSIRASMPENALLFLETPDVNWILKNNVLYDFFYEHCSYFNFSSLYNILCMTGFKTVEVKHTFNGQYMWIAARAVNRNGTMKNKQNKTKDTLMLCRKFADNREKQMNSISSSLKRLAQKEKTVIVWGAGAKGVTFTNLFDLHQNYISALIDINPDKQGRYVGITAHEVISAEKIPAKSNGGGGGGVIIILNKNYLKEIKRYLISHNMNSKMNLYLI